ncbi:hypothetical protein APS47_15395 [Leptospira kirschneri serovar Mozdok]|nr:Uncharacterized protein NV38_0001099 [Leptospira kirschneri serovar Mozdok]KPZ76472.1 hypothetical protein APS47_15395 [Leptospira kirschneri serovar Mozdok]NDK04641.1 hypothetical protein [Leptospira kirschneri serovar Mozdok]
MKEFVSPSRYLRTKVPENPSTQAKSGFSENRSRRGVSFFYFIENILPVRFPIRLNRVIPASDLLYVSRSISLVHFLRLDHKSFPFLFRSDQNNFSPTMRVNPEVIQASSTLGYMSPEEFERNIA